MSTAIPAGATVIGPTLTVTAASAINAKGALTTAPGTATSIAERVSARGRSGISTWTTRPAIPPRKSEGITGLPMKPVAMLIANVTILTPSTATRRPAPSVSI